MALAGYEYEVKQGEKPWNEMANRPKSGIDR